VTKYYDGSRGREKGMCGPRIEEGHYVEKKLFEKGDLNKNPRVDSNGDQGGGRLVGF